MGNNTKQKAFEVVSFLDHKKMEKKSSLVYRTYIQTRQVSDLWVWVLFCRNRTECDVAQLKVISILS